MSTGTKIIQQALRNIGAYSSYAPADPESITIGVTALNSLMQFWLSQGIDMGVNPISAPGDELSEPMDATNAIIDNLSLMLSPNFDNGRQVVSPQLRANARNGLSVVKGLYQVIIVPKKVASSTLPKGAGNYGGVGSSVFFKKGGTLGA